MTEASGSSHDDMYENSVFAIASTPDTARLSTADLCRALQTPCSLKRAFSRTHAHADTDASSASIDFEKACASTEMCCSQEKKEVRSSLEKSLEEPRVRLASKSQPSRAKTSQEVAMSVPVVLAIALPMLEGVLPRDEHGTCVIPHKHGLVQKKVRARIFTNAMGRVAYDTQRACDNCDDPIEERIFYSCAQGCEVDFCSRCYHKLQKLFENFDTERANWVVDFVEIIANFVLQRMDGKQRFELAQCLASEWPQSLFERLVAVVVGVADALVVHVQDNSVELNKSTQFWHIIGLLQVLYSANGLSVSSHQSMTPGPRVEAGRFAVRGIDKCDAGAEYSRWRDVSSSLVAHTQALVVDSLDVTEEFASFLTHSNLVPISFRQRCLQQDVQFMHSQISPRRRRPLKLGRAPREKAALLKFVVKAFGSSESLGLGQLAKELYVTFEGEPAAGPGVVREFLCLAMQSLLEPVDTSENFATDENGNSETSMEARSTSSSSSLDAKGSDSERCHDSKNNGDPLIAAVGKAASSEQAGNETAPYLKEKHLSDSVWEYDSQLHVYWFRDHCPASKPEEVYQTLHACGVILGHAIHSDCKLPTFFPQVLYAMLLQEISQQNKYSFTLSDLGRISPAIAQSLDRLLEYEGNDFLDLFRLDWPRGGELTSVNREDHVKDYIQWFFSGRYASRLKPLSDGFRAVVGQSRLLQAGLVDAPQLEQIICGAEMPVDVAALQAGATTEGWFAGDAEYLEDFWEVLRSFQERELRRFVLFVSSCSRAPPRGWQDLNLNVQRNGDGEDRLPTAFTCFNLLLLPRYASKDTLREKLLVAIAETHGFGLR